MEGVILSFHNELSAYCRKVLWNTVTIQDMMAIKAYCDASIEMEDVLSTHSFAMYITMVQVLADEHYEFSKKRSSAKTAIMVLKRARIVRPIRRYIIQLACLPLLSPTTWLKNMTVHVMHRCLRLMRYAESFQGANVNWKEETIMYGDSGKEKLGRYIGSPDEMVDFIERLSQEGTKRQRINN